MIYHEAAGAILLFGGANGGAETWRLTIPNLAGGFTPYGQSCGPATVLAGASGTATRVGAPFTAEVRGIPATATGGVLWIGGSQSNLGPFPLPLGLAFTGMPGCFLYQDLLLSQPLTITGSVGSWSVAIPAEARFVGMRLYFQGFLLLPGANLAGTVVTHGAELLVGGY